MSGGLLGALFAGVSGLDAESANLSIISNNVANANTTGYKQAEAQFQTLVTGSSSSTSYSPGGVTAGNRQLVDQQGLLQSTSSSTDIAIQGSGLFVVNTAASGSGQVQYTRAGSFTQDSLGNFVNAAGEYLQAWPLDRNGLLPGAPGNANTTSSANLNSLETVNVQSVAGTASATSNVSVVANLNSAETPYVGDGGDAIMDKQDVTNYGITANTIIVPTSTDNLTAGTDQIVVTTGTNPTGYTYTYGGYTTSRNVTDGADYGSSNTPLAGNVTLGSQPFSFTSGSNIVTINQAPPAGVVAGDVISLSGNTTAFNGLTASALTGDFYVTSATANQFKIALPTTTAAPVPVALATNSITNVNSGGTTITIAGTPPTNLAVGDKVSISGVPVGGITDSNGTVMYSANQLNSMAFTVASINGGSPATSYTLNVTDANGVPQVAGGGTAATGSVAFASNPSNGDTISLNGQTWTFVTSGGSVAAHTTTIQGTLANTLTQLASDLTASATAGNTHLNVATYGSTASTLTITSTSNSTAGNSYTLGTPVVSATQDLSGGVNAATATGSITFGATPSNGDTITLDGVAWEFNSSSGPTQTQITTGGSASANLSATLAQLASDLNAYAGANPASNIAKATYSSNGTQLLVTYATSGATGNSYTLAAGTESVPSNETVSGGHLAGGVTGVAASGTIPITANPTAGQSININGITWTFVASGGSVAAHTTTIQGTLANTLTQLASDLNASAATNTLASYSGVSGTSLAITYSTTGTAGNSFAFSDVVPARSGADLTGGVTTTNTGTLGSQGGSALFQFVDEGGTTGAVANSRLFTGDILDATTDTTPLISTPANYTTAALSFTITTTSGGTSTYTYTPSAPNAQLGQFSTLSNLAQAISATKGLTARVVNNQLYVAAVNGDDKITFANGSATGSDTTPPLAGIDWINELGVADVDAATNRFSSLQGLADLVNNSTGLSATVNNATDNADVDINVADPLDTISFADGTSNTGSLLAQLGLASSLNGGAYMKKTAGPFGPAYDPSNSAKNMASGAITPQFSRPLTVYDSQGTSHSLNVGFIKTGVNQWAVEIYAQPASDVTSSLPNGQVAYGTLKFNGDSSLESVSSLLADAINVNWTDGAESSKITIDWGTAGSIGTGETNGMSQFNAAFGVTSVNQNGAPVGGLSSVSISSTGLITANFSNGQTQNLYQIPLASFANPDELISASGNVFSQSSGSGQVILKQAGDSGVGTISSSSLEQSNVELADQLTSMIVAQNAYQANTKVISEVDTLLQDLDQIIQA